MHFNEAIATFPGFLGLQGGEVIVVLACLLVLIGARYLPEFFGGLGRGFSAFGAAIRDVTDEAAHDAGRSVGGIYGKPAAEALTPDNRTAELYDPAVFEKDHRPVRVPHRLAKRLFSFFHNINSLLKRVARTSSCH